MGEGVCPISRALHASGGPQDTEEEIAIEGQCIGENHSFDEECNREADNAEIDERDHDELDVVNKLFKHVSIIGKVAKNWKKERTHASKTPLRWVPSQARGRREERGKEN